MDEYIFSMIKSSIVQELHLKGQPHEIKVRVFGLNG